MPLDPHFFNLFQQNTAGKHTNHLKRQTTTYHIFFHYTIIQSQKQKNKTIRHSQDPLYFTLSTIQ